MANRLEKHFTEILRKRTHALKTIVTRAEEILSELIGVEFEESAWNLPAADILNYTDLKNIPVNTTAAELLNRSGVHLPIDVFSGGLRPLQDIDWTEGLESTFIANAKNDSTLFRQFVGLASGVTRIFPAKEWSQEPDANFAVDLFTPWFRPWALSALSCPKTVLFLIDYSGSVHGQTLNLIKYTIGNALAALSPNDYVTAIWYNNHVGHIIPCYSGFLQATTRNKLLLQYYLDAHKEVQEANLEKALEFAYLEFEKLDNMSKNLSDLNFGAGGHKMMFIFSDGTTQNVQSVVDRFAPLQGPKGASRHVDVRISTVTVGAWAEDVPALMWLACVNKGFYSKISNLVTIKEKSKDFMIALSSPYALALANVPVAVREPHWSGPYMDAQGEGSVMTLSMPVVDRRLNTSNQSFIGIAGIDVKLNDYRHLMMTINETYGVADLGSDAYAFAIDNNGHVIFHPELGVPETDLYMIRRTICFNMNHRTRPNQKILFGETTQRISQQMGFIDSIFNVDIVDIEADTPTMEDLRKTMIEQTCKPNVTWTSLNEKLTTEERKVQIEQIYTCRSLPGTPYSIAIALPAEGANAIDASPDLIPNSHDLCKVFPCDTVLDYFISPRTYCGHDFAAIRFGVGLRLKRLMDLWANQGCSYKADSKTIRLFAAMQVAKRWAHWWSQLLPKAGISTTPNNTCTKPDEFANHTEFPVRAFLQAAGGLTAVFPKCQNIVRLPEALRLDALKSPFYLHAKTAPSKLLGTFYTAEHEKLVNFYKGFVDRKNKRIFYGVAGIQVDPDLLYSFLNDSIMPLECYKENSTSTNCYLLDDTGTILSATNLGRKAEILGAFIGAIDPAIVHYLMDNGYMSNDSYKDYQARCSPPPPATSGSASSIRSDIKNFVVHLVVKFWFVLNSVTWESVWHTMIWSIQSTFAQENTEYATSSNEDEEGYTEEEQQELIDSSPLSTCILQSRGNTANCILYRYLYKFNEALIARKKVVTGFLDNTINCTRTFYLARLSSLSNMYLLQLDAKCPCRGRGCNDMEPLSREQWVDPCSELSASHIRYRKFPHTECALFHDAEELPTVCSHAAPGQRLAQTVVLLTMLLSIVRSQQYIMTK